MEPLDPARTDVVLLGAGRGTRLAPLTDRLPKVLVPVQGEPLLARHERVLRSSGFRRAVLVVGYLGEEVRRFSEQNTPEGLAVSFCEQRPARGTGDAVRTALSLVRSDPFVVLYGDVFLPELGRALGEFLASREPKIGVARVEDAGDFGRVLTGPDGRHLDRIVEKDHQRTPGAANAGLYLLPRSIETALARASRSPRGEWELTDAVERLAHEGTPIQVVDVGQWVDIGDLARLRQADLLR